MTTCQRYHHKINERTMLKKLFCFSFSVLIFNSSFVHAENKSPDAMIQKSIQPLLAEYKIPGLAIELYINGKLHEYYFGVSNKETKEPITQKTIFELGTLSHLMTNLLFAQEIDWAKMQLKDSIKIYLKDYADKINDVTLQDLSTYTSGLPYQLSVDFNNRDEVKDYLMNRVTPLESSDQWQYSHLNVALLGLALEASTEKTFSKLYYRHIMLPLAMVNGVEIPTVLLKYYAQGYAANGEPVGPISDEVFPAVMGIKASASDMQKFLAAAIGLPGTPTRILYPMRMTQSVYLKFGNESQGLGWQIHPSMKQKTYGLRNNVSKQFNTGPINIDEIYSQPTYDGDALIDKAGVSPGFSSYIAVLPNKHAGIVMLANKNVPNNAMMKTARTILLSLS